MKTRSVEILLVAACALLLFCGLNHFYTASDYAHSASQFHRLQGAIPEVFVQLNSMIRTQLIEGSCYLGIFGLVAFAAYRLRSSI